MGEITHTLTTHRSLTFSLSVKKPQAGKKLLCFQKSKIICLYDFKSDILASSLLCKPQFEIETLVHQYNKTLSSILEKHAPLNSKKVRVRLNTQWINKTINAAKKAKLNWDDCHKIWQWILIYLDKQGWWWIGCVRKLSKLTTKLKYHPVKIQGICFDWQTAFFTKI